MMNIETRKLFKNTNVYTPHLPLLDKIKMEFSKTIETFESCISYDEASGSVYIYEKRVLKKAKALVSILPTVSNSDIHWQLVMGMRSLKNKVGSYSPKLMPYDRDRYQHLIDIERQADGISSLLSQN